MNFRFPVFLDLRGKKCLVIGEGYEVPMKVQALVDASADVLYLNPVADAKIQALHEAGSIRWERRQFQPGDLTDAFLVISDLEDNSEVFRRCEEQRVLCNSVDDPEHCRFSFGSVHRQGELTIAISTNGWAPAVAVRLKEKLQREVGPEYGLLLEMLKEIRPTIGSSIEDFASRRELWYRIVDSKAIQLLREERRAEADSLIRALLEEAVAASLSNTSHSDTSAEGEHP